MAKKKEILEATSPVREMGKTLELSLGSRITRWLLPPLSHFSSRDRIMTTPPVSLSPQEKQGRKFLCIEIGREWLRHGNFRKSVRKSFHNDAEMTD